MSNPPTTCDDPASSHDGIGGCLRSCISVVLGILLGVGLLCISVVVGIIGYVGIMIWPCVSIVLGLLGGVILGSLFTLAMALSAILFTPMFILQMLKVTMTTKICFTGFMGRPMRLAVFLCVPLWHALVLLFGALLCLWTTLFMIGQVTSAVFTCDFTELVKCIMENLRFESSSVMGEIVQFGQEFMTTEDKSHTGIYFLKGTLSLLPGFVFGLCACLPYGLAILLITLYRLPINVYKTAKIALFSVLLQWDMRLFTLLTLPLVHVLFCILAFLGALLGSFFGIWFHAAENIANGKNPFHHSLDTLYRSLSRYHQFHINFVEVHCDPYDHPTGIPDGWDGTRYGIPVVKILLWQRDFLLACLLVVVEVPLCLVACTAISILKYIPTCLAAWRTMLESQCPLACWPFFLIAFLLVPAALLLCHVSVILFGTISTLVTIPLSYFFYNGNPQVEEDDNDDASTPGTWFKDALWVGWDAVCDHDSHTGGLTNNTCYLLGEDVRSENNAARRARDRRRQRRRPLPPPPPPEMLHEDHAFHFPNGWQEQQQEHQQTASWDRFMTQCIRTTAHLVESGMLCLEDVIETEPSAIQSIPSVAIWTILSESVMSEDSRIESPEDILWSVDGTICRKKDRSRYDSVLSHLWPMIMHIRATLEANKHMLVGSPSAMDGTNLMMIALLCSNTESERASVAAIVNQPMDLTRTTLYRQIRNDITELVFAVLRVRPYQERMEKIFTQDYTSSLDAEVASCKGLPQQEVEEDASHIESTCTGSSIGTDDEIGDDIPEHFPTNAIERSMSLGNDDDDEDAAMGSE